MAALDKVTWADLQEALEQRLGNPSFWTNAAANSEIKSLLRETLYYWGLVSYNFRERIVLTLSKDQRVYDLRTLSPFFESTLTSQDMVGEIQHHFLEPIGLTSWAGSDQFDLASINEALRRRRDQFLLESGIWVEQQLLTTDLPAVGSPRYALPNDVIDVRRIALLDLAGTTYTHLWRSDKLLIQNSPVLTGPPQFYTAFDSPAKQIEIVPPPDKIYKVDLYAVLSGVEFTPGSNLALGVPDEFAWAVKWGAIADLLGKDGSASDPARAEYAETRYRQGVRIARTYPAVMISSLSAAITVPIVSLHDLDAHKVDWQNATPGPPEALAMVGRNLLVVFPEPDLDDTYSLELDVLRPAPTEAVDRFIDVDFGAVDALVDYAQHIATFKEGGQEFRATMRHADNLLQLAGVEGERIRAQGLMVEEMLETGVREEKQRLRRSKPDPAQATELVHA